MLSLQFNIARETNPESSKKAQLNNRIEAARFRMCACEGLNFLGKQNYFYKIDGMSFQLNTMLHYTSNCECGEDLDNNCAHYLSNWMIKNNLQTTPHEMKRRYLAWKVSNLLLLLVIQQASTQLILNKYQNTIKNQVLSIFQSLTLF
ncbi:unnamed protein product [Rotaria magnacalcarata]